MILDVTLATELIAIDLEYVPQDLQATTAELLDIRQEFEQIKASRVDKGELLHARSDEVDRLVCFNFHIFNLSL